MTALLSAEEISCAANFQIAHRNFEPASQSGVLFDSAESFPHLGQEPGMTCQQQISVGLMFVAPDSPSQLVQVTQAKPVGPVDDDRVGVGNIEADDGSRKEDVRLAIDESGHHFLKFIAVHLPVADDDSRLWHQSCQLLGHGLNSHHPIVQKENLAASIQLALDRIAYRALVVLGDDRLNGQTIVGWCLDRAHVASASESQVKRARNGCGAECEHIDQFAQHLELFFVQHAETLLFVDNHQTKVFKSDITLQKPMSANDDIHRTSG